MKIQKTLFLFFLFVVISSVSLQVRGGYSGSNQLTFAAEKSFHLQVDSSFNETVYYIEVEAEILDFKVSVLSWGNLLPGSYEGLLIQLYFDHNESELNGWLIPYGDMIEHNFASENQFDGIIRLKFSSLSVELCEFTLTIEESYPIWTYEYDIFSNSLFVFGVERSVIYYSDIDKIVVELIADSLDQSNFTIELRDDYNNIVTSRTSSFITQEGIILVLHAETSLNYNKWYKLQIIDYSFDSLSSIRCQIYYDHYQLENVGRIFLQDTSKNLDEISLDLVHSHPSYQWIIEEDRKKPRIDIPEIYNYGSVLGSIFTIYGCLVVIAILFSIRESKKRRRKELISESFEPTSKINKQEYIAAEYAPDNPVGISFEEVKEDYSLETSEISKVQCSICLLVIKERKEIIRCPSCDMAFHKKHLYQWIVGNGTCPACKARLTVSKP